MQFLIFGKTCICSYIYMSYEKSIKNQNKKRWKTSCKLGWILDRSWEVFAMMMMMMMITMMMMMMMMNDDDDDKRLGCIIFVK